MNFPTRFHDLWRCQRGSFFIRVLHNDFDPRVYKIGLRLDFIWPNRDRSVTVGDDWQGGLYTKPEFRTSLPGISSEGVEL